MSKLHHRFVHQGGQGVLALHGFMGCLQEMEPLIPSHVSRLMVDLPGHGESLSVELLSWDVFCRELHALLLRYHLSSWIFYGYSMGGRLLLEYLKQPFALMPSHLILESVSPGKGLDTERRKQDESRAQELESSRGPGFFHRWYGQALFSGMPEHSLYSRLIAEKDRGNRHAWAQALRTFSVAQQTNCLAQLQGISGLFLYGQKDTRYRQWAKVFEVDGGFQSQDFAGAAHNVHFFYPGRVRELLSAYLLY